MSNPRNRNQMRQSASASAPARMAGLPVVPATSDQALSAFLIAVKERLEVREGGRGNPHEKVVTMRDLKDLGLSGEGEVVLDPEGKPTAIVVPRPGGFTNMTVDEFAEALRGTRAWQNLVRRLDDPRRFDGVLSDEIRAILLEDIAAVAAKNDARLSTVEYKVQTATKSIAARVQEVTAHIDDAVAGVRQTAFAAADLAGSQAGIINQVNARLNDVGGTGATVEETLLATADRVDGFAAEYFVKVQAGNKVAGVSLAATEDPQGNSESAFIVMADKFAVVGPNDVISNPKFPPTNRVPFGIDTATNTIFINGQVRINAGGKPIGEIGDADTINYIGSFPSHPSLASYPFNSVYTNTTDGNSYIKSRLSTGDPNGSWQLFVPAGQRGVQGLPGAQGSPGTPGSPGPAGARGTVNIFTTGSFWNDQHADDALAAIIGPLGPSNPRRVGDQVTIRDNNLFAQMRYWSGFQWSLPGVIIDGNLLVRGTISADKVGANQIAAHHLQAGSINAEKLGVNSITATNGAIQDLAVSTFKIGNNAVTVPVFQGGTFEWDGQKGFNGYWIADVGTISLPAPAAMLVSVFWSTSNFGGVDADSEVIIEVNGVWQYQKRSTAKAFTSSTHAAGNRIYLGVGNHSVRVGFINRGTSYQPAGAFAVNDWGVTCLSVMK